MATEGVAGVLALNYIIIARSLALHVCPASVVPITGAIDAADMPIGGIGIGHDNSGGHEFETPANEPALGVLRHIFTDPEAIQFNHHTWVCRTGALLQVTTWRATEGANTLQDQSIVKAKRE